MSHVPEEAIYALFHEKMRHDCLLAAAYNRIMWREVRGRLGLLKALNVHWRNLFMWRFQQFCAWVHKQAVDAHMRS